MSQTEVMTRAFNRIAKLTEAAKAESSLIEFAQYVWPVVEPAIPFVRGWVLEAICEHLEAVTNGQIRRLLINVPPGFTKPVRKDVSVQTLRGTIPLSDVVIGDYILTHSGKFRAVTAIHEQGILPIVMVKTWCGREIPTAPDHPFLTTRGWIQAQDLDDQDILAATSPVESFGVSLDHKEARFLGYLIGDGCVKHGGITFTNLEPDVLEDFIECSEYLDFVTRQTIKKGCRATCINLSAKRSGRLQKFLEVNNLRGKDSYTKRIPTSIMNADYDTAANFLGAYWSCDGYVAVRHTGNKTAYLAKLTTVGAELAKDIQVLALRLGINLRLRRREAKLQSKRQGQKYVSYDLEATNQNEIYKISRLPGLCARKRLAVREARPRWFLNHLMPDPVVSVTEDTPAECRCLTVEEDHSFVANGVAVHNSLMTDVFWPAWEWGPRNMPWTRYVCASYSNHLTERDNMRCRNIVLSDRYKKLWGDRFKISNEQFTKVKFANDHTGWKLATSVGGIGVGERGDRFIIDDANNTMMMESEATRDNVNMWFTEVVPDRLNNQQTSAIMVIQQRLHEDDVSGTALSREMGYTHLMIPMEHDVSRHCKTSLGWDANGREIIWEDPRTEENELAWPERFPQQSVDELRRDKGPYAWCSTAEAPILMADLSMKRIDKIRVGDKIVGFKIGGNARRARLKCGEVLSISKTFQPIVKITLDSGEVVRCTANHKWWTGRNDSTHPPYAPAGPRSTLSRVCPPRLPELSPDDARLAGWLSGFFDGEGTVSVNHRRPEDEGSALIAFSQGDGRNGPLCDKLEYALEHFGFNFGVWERSHRGKDKTPDHKLRTYWLKMAKEGRASRIPLYQRFLHIVQPTKWRERLIECSTSGRLYTGSERVISIQPDGCETVYGLETTTGNYVAWGLASSNSGQYQQSPEPRGGSIIKRDFWQIWDEERYPKFEFIVASLDPAFTAKEENDPSALTVWGVYGGADGNPKVMLIWAMEARMEFHALMELVIDVCTVDKKLRAHPRFPVDRLLIESKASGMSVGQEMYRLYGLSGKFGIELIDPKIYGDKVARVQSIQHLFSSGMIYAPGKEGEADREWVSMVINQCAVFPKGSKDDLVDSTSQALRWLRDSNFMPSSGERKIQFDAEFAYNEPLRPLYDV